MSRHYRSGYRVRWKDRIRFLLPHTLQNYGITLNVKNMFMFQ